MNESEVQALVAGGEGQRCEFKESMSAGRQREAIRSLTAFANTTGGTVLFGVADDGTVTGLDVGRGSLEEFANRILRRTYPRLEVEVIAVELGDDHIVAAETFPDRPPFVGAYLYATTDLDPRTRVPAELLESRRRVGRTDQKFDFMRLREAMPTDPSITFRSGGARTRGAVSPRMWEFVYSNGGPGWAHNMAFEVEHPSATFTVSGGPTDLPPPSEDDPRNLLRPRRRQIACEDPDATPGHNPVLHATCEDMAGLKWRFSVELEVQGNDEYRLGRRERLIVEFPPPDEIH